MHHLLELLPLDAYYSAAKFQEDCEAILNDIFYDRDTAIVCGGSMLYLDALTKGIDDLPTVPSHIRETLMKEWEEKGNEWLLNSLQEKDPDYYIKIDHRNLKRVFHALEISLTAGKPYSSLLTHNDDRSSQQSLPFDVTKFCLTGQRDLLFERINSRVIKMIDSGLEEEARSVYHLRHLNSLNTVGLKEMFEYFDGNMALDNVVARIQKNTRVYAKKQLTWHKRDESLNYLDFSDSPTYNINKILEKIL